MDLRTAATTTKGRKTGKVAQRARSDYRSKRKHGGRAKRSRRVTLHHHLSENVLFWGASPSSTSDCCCCVLFCFVFRSPPCSAPPHRLGLSSILVLFSTLSAYAIPFVFVCVVLGLCLCNSPLLLFVPLRPSHHTNLFLSSSHSLPEQHQSHFSRFFFLLESSSTPARDEALPHPPSLSLFVCFFVDS